MHPDDTPYLSWFVLREIPRVGTRNYHRLIQAMGTPDAVLSADPDTLSAIPGISRQIAETIQGHALFHTAARSELSRVLARGYRVSVLTDPDYPPLLKTIPDPPPILTYQGALSPLMPCIAIVGSRNASSYGIRTARQLAGRLSEKGFVIVSGMARGIDAAAHTGALEAGGQTLAILGSGLNKIYPWENRHLYHRIREQGAVLSEFKLDTDPFPYNFPARNRIIAGISTGTIVVEAEKKSGSLITARLAADYNREVFAVPGSIQSRRSQGTHFLLRQGARLVETATDVLEELLHFVHPDRAPSLPETPMTCHPDRPVPLPDAADMQICNLLDAYPCHIDRIISRSGLDSPTVSAILLKLELQGIVIHHPGNFFSLPEA